MTISIGEYMTSRHKHCDELFIAAETAVYKKRWDAARAALGGRPHFRTGKRGKPCDE